jgi:hypothetical protein
MTARFTPPPRLDPQRIGILFAFDALIELRLDTTRNAEPLAAERLLRWLEHTGCATVTAKADRTMTLTLMGLRATATDASPAALLRCWQREARDLMTPGVRG